MYFDLSQQNDKGICPVIYEGLKVASSLEEFLRRLDQKENYYIYFDVINYTEVKK
jgi:antitoxin YxxD